MEIGQKFKKMSHLQQMLDSVISVSLTQTCVSVEEEKVGHSCVQCSSWAFYHNIVIFKKMKD